MRSIKRGERNSYQNIKCVLRYKIVLQHLTHRSRLDWSQLDTFSVASFAKILSIMTLEGKSRCIIIRKTFIGGTFWYVIKKKSIRKQLLEIYIFFSNLAFNFAADKIPSVLFKRFKSSYFLFISRSESTNDIWPFRFAREYLDGYQIKQIICRSLFPKAFQKAPSAYIDRTIERKVRRSNKTMHTLGMGGGERGGI